MKIIKVQFEIRYIGNKETTKIVEDVEVESDSTEKELDYQIKDFYYKEVLSRDTSNISQTYDYKILR